MIKNAVSFIITTIILWIMTYYMFNTILFFIFLLIALVFTAVTAFMVNEEIEHEH